MPQPDPLDTVMTNLRKHGGIDPNTQAKRKAQLKDQRTTLGATPPATRKPPQQGVGGRGMPKDVMPRAPGTVVGGDREALHQQPNMMGSVIDALNEAIIGLKTEIHRAPDEETKKKLQAEAQSIRDRIVDLGGEPVWADETIEQGLQKLRGLGFVTQFDSNWQQGSNWWDMSSAPGGWAPSGQEAAPGQHTAGPGPMHPHAAQPQAPAQQEQASGAGGRPSWTNPFLNQQQTPFPGVQVPSVSAPRVTAPRVNIPEVPETPDTIPDYFSPHVQEKDQKITEMQDLISRITGRDIGPRPERVVDHEYVSRMMEQFGVEPRSQEEIEEHARALVERQALGQEQLIQREIERFESDFPDEFAKAEERIREAAAELSADKQEEMAARGMFYSSIMAESVEKLDDAAVREISEISAEAARYVAGLNRELRDIEQWKILETEVVRHMLETEDQNLRRQLMGMQIEVASWADQMALDEWYREQTLQMQSEQLQLQGLQMQLAMADQHAQWASAAFMADHPLVQQSLINMGITPEMYGQMDLPSQAHLVQSVVQYNDIEQNMRARELQMHATVASLHLEQARLTLQASIASAEMSLQAQIASGQFSMQAQQMGMQWAMHQDSLALDWAHYGLAERQVDLASRGRGGGAAAQDPMGMFLSGAHQMVMSGDMAGLQAYGSMAAQRGDAVTAQYVQDTMRTHSQQQTRALQSQLPPPQEPKQTSWLQNLFGGRTHDPMVGQQTGPGPGGIR